MDPKQIRYIQNAIRTAYKKMPANADGTRKPGDIAWNEARVGYGKYRCATCAGIFGPTEVHRDHIEPCIDPSTGFVDWNTYHARVNPGPEGWAILCKPCHYKKSKAENATRRKVKNARAT